MPTSCYSTYKAFCPLIRGMDYIKLFPDHSVFRFMRRLSMNLAVISVDTSAKSLWSRGVTMATLEPEMWCSKRLKLWFCCLDCAGGAAAQSRGENTAVSCMLHNIHLWMRAKRAMMRTMMQRKRWGRIRGRRWGRQPLLRCGRYIRA